MQSNAGQLDLAHVAGTQLMERRLELVHAISQPHCAGKADPPQQDALAHKSMNAKKSRVNHL